MMIEGTRTTCPYCGVGCGVIARPQPDGAVQILGDPDHPANHGRLCSKGSALGETLGLKHRLLQPLVDGEPASWELALDRVAQGFDRIRTAHGADAVAFYISGQLLTEDYYVANKLMKGYLGTANIDTNSRLCMSSPAAAHKRAFGQDTVPGCYEDLELADLVVLVGSNLAWCHPVIHQRILAAKTARPQMKLVVIDPRRTPSCDQADLHLPLKPGTDVLLYNGLLVHLAREDKLDLAFLEHHAQGYAAALATARAEAGSIPQVALGCGLAEDDVARFFAWFARTERVVSVFSQGVNQSSAGTDKCNAIINCHLACGRIGRPGMGPFSITGQPNAMGGREVGGMANLLAAHMDLDNAEHRQRVQRFWNSPVIASTPGLKAVDLFEAVHAGHIKALWIMATNPLVSMPNADRVREALRCCELVVVSDMTQTDTTALAHVVLPAATWGEREGTVTNSERCITRQRTFLPLPGEARPDWWIICEVAKRMGFNGFDYEGPWQIFREHAELSGLDNAQGERDFDISALGSLTRQDYENLQPMRWPINSAQPKGTDRLFGDGRFYTPERRARLVPVGYRPPVNLPSAEFPFVLNTGRIRDQWHTMTRTGQSPRLSNHIVEPYAELHPADAARLHLADAALARLRSPWGEMLARVKLNPGQRMGCVFVPMHWNAQFAAQGRVDALVNPAVDPISGEPELKHTPVAITAYEPSWYGFALARQPLHLSAIAYWVKATCEECYRYELAGELAPLDWSTHTRDLLEARAQDEWLEYEDRGAKRYRAALIREGRLEACLFVAPDRELPSRTWLAGLFGQAELDAADRLSLLAGRPSKAQADAGEIVCACYQVGRNSLIQGIQRDGLMTPEAIGKALKAGTNCGSCVPELKQLIAQYG